MSAFAAGKRASRVLKGGLTATQLAFLMSSPRPDVRAHLTMWDKDRRLMYVAVDGQAHDEWAQSDGTHIVEFVATDGQRFAVPTTDVRKVVVYA